MTGRYFEVKMYPFSFKEFLDYKQQSSSEELFNEYVAGIHAESQLLIQGQEVDIDMECDDKTIEYFEFERFYELFGYGLSKEGIDADLIITVRDTRGETLYYVFYPTIYGGDRWVWINPIVAK